MIYDHTTKKPVDGLALLPVDLNGNGKISDDERFSNDLAAVVQRLEQKSSKELNNIPIEYINLSVDKTSGSPDAIAFLRWVIHNGLNDLHDFGYLKPEPVRFGAEKLEFFSSQLPK